jgi:hypothetical protein
MNLDPQTIRDLMESLRQTMDAQTDPAIKAQIAAWIAILASWLTRTPGWYEVARVLQAILAWANGGAIGVTEGVLPGASSLVVDMGPAPTILGLEIGGSAGAVAGAAVFLVFALTILGISIYKTATSPSLALVAGASCCTTPAATGLGPVSDWGILENQAGLWDNVMKKAQQQCDAFASKCTGTCAPPLKCRPNVSLQSFDISNYFVYRTVTFKSFNCVCECLSP